MANKKVMRSRRKVSDGMLRFWNGRKERAMIRVRVECSSGHEQTIKYDESFSLEWVETQCGLLDGTSPLYEYPPGPESVIGKCGICGKQVKCSIVPED